MAALRLRDAVTTPHNACGGFSLARSGRIGVSSVNTQVISGLVPYIVADRIRKLAATSLAENHHEKNP